MIAAVRLPAMADNTYEVRPARSRLAQAGSESLTTPNNDLGAERSPHRALVGDFEQLRSLCIVKEPHQLDLPFDLIEHPDLGLAIFAVPRVDPRVPEPNRHGFERPLLSSRVKSDGHRCAGPQCRE